MKKIFVSSTFRDFNVERDAIRNLVMPRLNVIAQKYAETVSFVDLRWGVDTNTLETNEGVKKVLDVCLDEINNCKPYIIVLLGQRYGFLPTDTGLITEATKAKNFSLDNPNISVTEMEIEYGALKNLGHTRFYFREIKGDIPPEEQQNYFSDENADKLKVLKERIEELSKENDEIGNKAVLKKYSLGWDTANNSLSKNLDKFVDMPDKIEDLIKFFRETVASWGMEEHTERLVIIIDAVDQLFDDVYKNNLSFIPSNLSDKVQLIFSCLDNFPTVGIPTIDVQLLSADNKSEIIKGILDSSKQLGNSVVRKICEMNASDNPLYLSLLIQRLEMMNYTDFQRIYTRAGELKTQNETHYEMEAINQVQIDIIENCSEKLEDFCVELIELAAEIFGSFITLVVNYIAISRYGLRESDLDEIFE